MRAQPHGSISMAWYDFFARIYDRSLEDLYRPYREQAFSDVELEQDALVVDVACGTAQSLTVLAPKLASANARYVGVDLSEGMLRAARERSAKSELDDGHLSFLRQEVGTITPEQLLAAGGKEQADLVVFALGLTVVPNWEQTFDEAFALLRAGGRMVIMDVHARKRDFKTRLVEMIARADLNRQVWTRLETEADAFALTWTDAPQTKMGGSLFFAHGSKRP